MEFFFNKQVIQLCTDNGGEYLALKIFLAHHGVSHLTTPLHTLEHNGYLERRHRHIVETGLTLLHHVSMSLSFWPEAFAIAIYFINQLPKHNLRFLFSYHELFGQSPNLTKLQVFGCLCYPLLHPYNSHKLESKSKPCVFIGYSLSKSAYICLDLTTQKTYTSRHVTFVISIFPFATSNPSPPFSFTKSWFSPHLSTLAPTGTPPLNIFCHFLFWVTRFPI